MSKICVKCNNSKELTEFYKRSAAKDRLDSYCKKCRTDIAKSFYINNIEEQRERVLLYSRENKEAIKQQRNLTKPERNVYQVTYRRERAKIDPVFKMKLTLSRIASELFSGKPRKRTLDLLGCTYEDFKNHIEGMFQPGMTWDNYGLFGWHIDHTSPLSLAKSEGELEKLCHYTNLQPLWASENIKKGNKLAILSLT